MSIRMRDEVVSAAAEPGEPAKPAWRSITFIGAQPGMRAWKAMRSCKPESWRRIRIKSRYHSYVRFTCYDPKGFAEADAKWIEETWLKLLLVQE